MMKIVERAVEHPSEPSADQRTSGERATPAATLNHSQRPVRIVIIAKAPQPGFAKTRLIAALGAQGAADLARRMLTHTVTEALAADVGTVELCVAPVGADPLWQSMPEIPDAVLWSEQGDGDLGQRMARAARRILSQGQGQSQSQSQSQSSSIDNDSSVAGEKNVGEPGIESSTESSTETGVEAVLLIGTDCPQLDRAMLQRAANALQRADTVAGVDTGADAVLLPTFDGGYALLGLTRFHSSLFEGIAWSTDSVAFDTLHRLGALGWNVQRLPMLHDIDDPADLEWVPCAWLDGLRNKEY
jgi:glycosyltransferase A (GT-A) superfamily protein (DUF2064 family)